MEKNIAEGDKRIEQNILGAVFIFVGVYFFFKGQMDGLALGILSIMGIGVSKDIRSVLLFSLKWGISKSLGKPTPHYDFSKAQIVQKSKGNAIVNYGTINYGK